MCGRFGLTVGAQQLAELLGLDEIPDATPRFNIAPTQDVLTVRLEDGRRRAATMRWGLVPSWAKDVKIGAKMINARSETAPDKPAFRAAFKRRRCLVPADGFYEWQRVGKSKRAFHFHLRSGQPFAMAGLWEVWRDPAQPEATPLVSCTVLTTDCNELVRPVHDRMPVILPREAWAPWLDPGVQDADALTRLLAPYPSAAMEATPVGSYVNDARHEGPACRQAEGLLL